MYLVGFIFLLFVDLAQILVKFDSFFVLLYLSYGCLGLPFVEMFLDALPLFFNNLRVVHLSLLLASLEQRFLHLEFLVALFDSYTAILVEFLHVST